MDGVSLGGCNQLRVSQLYEQCRWQPGGNGVRFDSSDRWSDAILTGSAGPESWAWGPESNWLAFSAINADVGGTWRSENGDAVITRSSGWRARLAPQAQGPLQVRI